MRHVSYPIEGVAYAPDDLADGWLASGGWSRHTIGGALRGTAEAMLNKPAFISDDRTITFHELDEGTDRLAAALLALGLAPGDRAMVQIGTNVEAVMALVAFYKASPPPDLATPTF